MVHSESKQSDGLADRLWSVLKKFEKQFPKMESKVDSLNLGLKGRGTQKSRHKGVYIKYVGDDEAEGFTNFSKNIL